MLKVTFAIDDTGEEFVVDATGHASLMQVAVENDVPGIEGECGGDLTCGTCHVHVEHAPDGYAPEQGADELDMLEVVAAPGPCSRMACQLPVTDAVEGLRLRVPLS